MMEDDMWYRIRTWLVKGLERTLGGDPRDNLEGADFFTGKWTK